MNLTSRHHDLPRNAPTGTLLAMHATTTMTDLGIQNDSPERLDALNTVVGYLQCAPSSVALTAEILDDIASGRRIGQHMGAIAGSGWEHELLPLVGWWIKLQECLLVARVGYRRPSIEDEAWIQPAVTALDNFMAAYVTGLTANSRYRRQPDQADAARLVRLYRIYTQSVAALPGDLWPMMNWSNLSLFL